MLILIILTEVGVGIAGYIKHSELNETVGTQFNNTLDHFQENPDIQRAWKMIQTELNCCGINNKYDWQRVYNNNGTYPASCCEKDKARNCTTDRVDKEEGCKGKLLKLLDDNALMLGAVGLTIAAIQV